MVVNDPANIPKTILVRSLGLRNAEVIRFLDELVQPGLNNGVKRNDYYLINVDGVLRIPMNPNPKLLQIFGAFMNQCSHNGINFLMIKYK